MSLGLPRFFAAVASLLAWSVLCFGCMRAAAVPDRLGTSGALQGTSVQFTFHVDLEASLTDSAPSSGLSVMESTVAVMKRRLEALRVREAEVRIVGDETILVTLKDVPEASPPEILGVLLAPELLAFRIVDEENCSFSGLTETVAAFKKSNPAESEGLELVIGPSRPRCGSRQVKPSGPDGVAAEPASANVGSAASGDFMLRATQKQTLARFALELAKSGVIPSDRMIGFQQSEEVSGGSGYPQKSGWEAVCLVARAGLTGKAVAETKVQFGRDERPQIGLVFSPAGAEAFQALTRANVGRKLAIMLGDVVYSAPLIKEAIAGGMAIITLGNNQTPRQALEEAQRLQHLLSTGTYAAPVTLVRTSP